MYIAFQKKNEKNCFHRLISFFTNSDIVHCELVSIKNTKEFFGYSSYPNDGVRSAWIHYDPSEWIFIELKDVKTKDIKDFFERTKGRKYDWLGCLGFVFGNPDNPKRYFCSEWCAEALGLENPSKISPDKLYKILMEKKDD